MIRFLRDLSEQNPLHNAYHAFCQYCDPIISFQIAGKHVNPLECLVKRLHRFAQVLQGCMLAIEYHKVDIRLPQSLLI